METTNIFKWKEALLSFLYKMRHSPSLYYSCAAWIENHLSSCNFSCILLHQHCYSSHATAANLGCQVKHDVETEKHSWRNTSVLNHEWLCGSKMPFWITPGNEVESGKVSGVQMQLWEEGAVPGQAVPPLPAEYFAGLLWAHWLWLGAAASSVQCSSPNTFQMINMMQTYWKKMIFLGRKTITSQSETMELNQCYVGIKQNRTFGQWL